MILRGLALPTVSGGKGQGSREDLTPQATSQERSELAGPTLLPSPICPAHIRTLWWFPLQAGHTVDGPLGDMISLHCQVASGYLWPLLCYQLEGRSVGIFLCPHHGALQIAGLFSSSHAALHGFDLL